MEGERSGVSGNFAKKSPVRAQEGRACVRIFGLLWIGAGCGVGALDARARFNPIALALWVDNLPFFLSVFFSHISPVVVSVPPIGSLVPGSASCRLVWV